MSESATKYSRVMLKISGEALMGDQGYGLHPPTVARMLTHSFVTMLTLSTLIGSVTGFIGMNLSYHLDIQSGPAIVLVGAALFAVAFATSGPSKRSKLAAVPNR